MLLSSVLKMIALMESSAQQQQQSGQAAASGPSGSVTPDCPAAHAKDFLSSGRTGRRNALPDILGEHALVTSSDLPARLQGLTTADPAAPGSSKDAGGGGQS